MRTSLKREDAIAFAARMSSDIRRTRIRWMTYARQKEIFQEEGGQVGPPREAGFAVNGQCLLADGALARLTEFGDFFVPQAFELEQRDVALGGCEPPFVELPVDGGAQAFEDVLGFAAPPLRFGASLDELAVEPFGPRACRRELP